MGVLVKPDERLERDGWRVILSIGGVPTGGRRNKKVVIKLGKNAEKKVQERKFGKEENLRRRPRSLALVSFLRLHSFSPSPSKKSRVLLGPIARNGTLTLGATESAGAETAGLGFLSRFVGSRAFQARLFVCRVVFEGRRVCSLRPFFPSISRSRVVERRSRRTMVRPRLGQG